MRSARALVAIAILAIAAGDAEPRPWTIRAELEGAGWYDLALQPGETYESALLLANPTDGEPVTLAILAVPEVNASAGGFALAANPAASELLDWLDFDSYLIDLAPGQAERLPFVLSIPEDAEPGTFGAGFVAFVPQDQSEPSEGGAIVINRTAISLQVRVGDPDLCAIQFDGVEVGELSDGVAVVLSLANVGNVPFLGAGSINVRSTNQSWAAVLEIGYSLPGAIFYPIQPQVGPGNYELTAEVWADSDPTCRATFAHAFTLAEPEPEPGLLAQIFEGLRPASASDGGPRVVTLDQSQIREALIKGIGIAVLLLALFTALALWRFLVVYGRKRRRNQYRRPRPEVDKFTSERIEKYD